MLEYKVVPIFPKLGRSESGTKIAEELQGVIQKYTNDGWQYCRIESLSTWVAPSGGCFGIGAQPGYNFSIQMIVFQKSLS